MKTYPQIRKYFLFLLGLILGISNEKTNLKFDMYTKKLSRKPIGLSKKRSFRKSSGIVLCKPLKIRQNKQRVAYVIASVHI